MKTVSAPGKVILAGEHAVVYGYPGIYAAVDKRLSVKVQHTDHELTIISSHNSTDHALYAVLKIGEMIGKDVSNLEITVDSSLPVGSGMGSSAALAVAMTGALTKYYGLPWELGQINEIAFEIEKKQHGSPSGGDNTAVTYGGFLKYRRQQGVSPELEKIANYRIIKNLMIIDSGRPQETTAQMVNKVKTLWADNKSRFDDIFSRIGEIAEEFYRYLSMKSETIEILDLFRKNHRLLSELKVVSPSAQAIVEKIEHAGGAAKISGAGGSLTGSGILLAYSDQPHLLVELAKKERWSIIPVTLGAEGVSTR